MLSKHIFSNGGKEADGINVNARLLHLGSVCCNVLVVVEWVLGLLLHDITAIKNITNHEITRAAMQAKAP